MDPVPGMAALWCGTVNRAWKKRVWWEVGFLLIFVSYYSSLFYLEKNIYF